MREKLMRSCIYIILIVFLMPLYAFADGGIDYKILKIADRVFYNTNKPTIKVAVSNNTEEKHSGSVLCRVESFAGDHIFDFGQDFTVAPSDSSILSFTFGLERGFYRVSLFADNILKAKAAMAYEPEQTGFAQDSTFDLDYYYGDALKQLRRIPLYALVEKQKKACGKLRDVYKVSVRSTGGRYFEGYYLYPKKRGTYPVVITCAGKDEELAVPDADCTGERIDFVISPRKSTIHNESYYMGAYMDVIRAIDFVSSRKEADLRNIYLNGTGDGGAMVLAAAALDKRAAAVSVYAPGYTNRGAVEGSRPYNVKNISEYIECPVVMGAGLEDDICPAPSNFEIYNSIKSRKEYYIFIEGHCPPADWKEIADTFYMKHKR